MGNGRAIRIFCAATTMALVAACGNGVKPTAARPTGAATLKLAFDQMTADALARDREAVSKAMAAMRPSLEELAEVLRPGSGTDAWLAHYAARAIEMDERGGHPLANVKRTQIVVHQASTEELAARAPGSTADMKFPPGMKRFAQYLARPGRTWFVVEAREPGSTSGVVYSCFTQLGERMLFIANPWRGMDAVAATSSDGSPAPN